jgi:hypothetical protein
MNENPYIQVQGGSTLTRLLGEEVASNYQDFENNGGPQQWKS